MQGQVKDFRGTHGFIMLTDERGLWVGGRDFFFHISQVIGEAVHNGDVVEFWLDDSPNRDDSRWVAVNVTKIHVHPPVPVLDQ